MKYLAPSYAKLDAFRETEIIGQGEWGLPGSLTVPSGAGPFRAMMLVYGPGPNDRDETIGPNKPFNDLVRFGIEGVVFCVMKRTRQHSAKLVMAISRQ